MKPALLATVLALASSASAKLSFYCLASDKIVDVGDLNVFDAVWRQFYASATDIGVLSDKDYQQNTKRCVEDPSDYDLTVNVKLHGRWGEEGEVMSQDMKNLLVQVMWTYMEPVTKDSGYDVYTNCGYAADEPTASKRHPFQSSEGGVDDRPRPPNYHEEAACGPKSRNGDCSCRKIDIECMGKVYEHKVPSEVTIEVHDDNKLLPDEYTVTFTAVGREDDEHGGCGRYGAGGEVLLGLLPPFGPYFEKVLKIYCRQ